MLPLAGSLAGARHDAWMPACARKGTPGKGCRYNSPMQITLNGHPHDCGDYLTLTQLLLEAGYAGRRVAVEVNLEIVPRSQHEGYALREGDKVEIVHAIGGG